MTKIIPTLLLLPVCWLSIGVAYSTDPSSATLDLRPPMLRNIEVQLAPEVTLRADADETEVVAIMGAPLAPQRGSNTHLSRTGIGSIYWAARHPAQAWTVLLPIAPHDGSAASEDIRVRCATFVRPSGGQATCP